MREAAATVKRVTLELGGKSPNIIFADADLPAAVRGAQNGIFYGKGEVCAAGSRLLVEQTVHDQVVEQLAERARKLTPGDPFDKNTRLGAIVSRSEEHTSELQSPCNLVCRLLLEKKKTNHKPSSPRN